jgi:pantothenate kinase
VFDGAREQLAGERRQSWRGLRWLVVEGVFVARLPSAARAYAVYVDIPEEEARTRVLARDVGRGRSPDEVRRRLDGRYLPAHARYQAEVRPRDRAALVVDNRQLDVPRIIGGALPETSGWSEVRQALSTVLRLSTAP